MSDEQAGETQAAQSLGQRATGALEIVVKAVAIAIPILYAVGRVYVESYWQALHLPPSLMNYATEDYLYFGFASLVLEIARLLGLRLYTTMAYTVFFAFTVAALAMIAIVVDRWISKRIRSRIVEFQKRVQEAKNSKYGDLIHLGQMGALVWSVLTIGLLVLMTISVLLLAPIAVAVNAGKEQAAIEIDKHTSHPRYTGTIRPPVLVHYKNNGVTVTAQLIDCSESWCIIFDQGEFAAIPRTDIYRIGQERKP